MICRQLGYNSVKDYYINSYFGSVPEDFSYTSVSCYGDENRLEDCSLYSGSTYSCSKYSGAGVSCSLEDEHEPEPEDYDPDHSATSEFRIIS